MGYGYSLIDVTSQSQRCGRFYRPLTILMIIAACLFLGYGIRLILDYWSVANKIEASQNLQGKDPSLRRIQTNGGVAEPVSDTSTKFQNLCNGKCSVGFCGDNLPYPTIFDGISGAIQVFQTKKFTCSGTIVAWRLIDYDPSPDKSVYLDVIKYQNATDIGTWLSFNEIKTNGEPGWQTYEVPISDRIKIVQEAGVEYFYGFHYNDIGSNNVIPFTDRVDAEKGIDQLDTGVAIFMDHKDLGTLLKPGVPPMLTLSKAFAALNTFPKEKWRTAALAAIVKPDNS